MAKITFMRVLDEKSYLTVLAGLVAITAVLGLSGCTKEPDIAEKAAFVPATNGDDNNPGTVKRPFATLGRAQQAVRHLISRGPHF